MTYRIELREVYPGAGIRVLRSWSYLDCQRETAEADFTIKLAALHDELLCWEQPGNLAERVPGRRLVLTGPSLREAAALTAPARPGRTVPAHRLIPLPGSGFQGWWADRWWFSPRTRGADHATEGPAGGR